MGSVAMPARFAVVLCLLVYVVLFVCWLTCVLGIDVVRCVRSGASSLSLFHLPYCFRFSFSAKLAQPHRIVDNWSS